MPHPCLANYIWHGVGHKNVKGGGERNPFGLDFAANSFVSYVTFCISSCYKLISIVEINIFIINHNGVKVICPGNSLESVFRLCAYWDGTLSKVR